MSMPSAERVNAELAALGDLVPDLPNHDHEMGTGYPDLRGQVPVTLPPDPATRPEPGADRRHRCPGVPAPGCCSQVPVSCRATMVRSSSA